MCYVNSKTEQFYLKARAEHVPMSTLPVDDARAPVPRELIYLDLEQPIDLAGYEYVDFFVTGMSHVKVRLDIHPNLFSSFIGPFN